MAVRVDDSLISNGNGNKIQMVMLFGFIRWINAYSKVNSIKIYRADFIIGSISGYTDRALSFDKV